MAVSLPDQLKETIAEFHMILPGERVAVACSGGADSTALLLLLNEIAESLGCVLSVAHLNHCLRGQESDADAEFVRQMAARLGIPCQIERAEVGKLARLSRTNREAQAREVRLRFFLSLIRSGQADRVALAHTADDQAETVLYRLVRGAGTRGLTGIHPTVEGKIIRPLIEARRDALRAWLAARGQPWREDSSNQDLRLARNRIRHEVLPLLAEFNPRIIETLAHTAAIARQEEAFWNAYLEPIRASWVRWEGAKAILNLDQLREAPPAVAYRVLRWAAGKMLDSEISAHGTQPHPISFLHIQRLWKWALAGQSGHALLLPNKLEARKEFSHLILRRWDSAKGPVESREARGDYSYAVRVPSTLRLKERGIALQFEFIPLGTGQPSYNEKGNILLDVKVAESPLSLRNWRAGDAYRQEGHRSPKKLQDLFQRMRIPVYERTGWPVLLAGEQIIWVGGMAVADGFGPKPGSSQAIAVRETGAE
jgi:tRNA(Ile)-lysidine synthase